MIFVVVVSSLWNGPGWAALYVVMVPQPRTHDLNTLFRHPLRCALYELNTFTMLLTVGR